MAKTPLISGIKLSRRRKKILHSAVADLDIHRGRGRKHYIALVKEEMARRLSSTDTHPFFQQCKGRTRRRVIPVTAEIMETGLTEGYKSLTAEDFKDIEAEMAAMPDVELPEGETPRIRFDLI